MKKLQKQGKGNRITRKILMGALVIGLTLLPGCKTSNNIPNQFKNKQPMVDNMEKQKERKIDLKSVPKKEEKEKPKKIKKKKGLFQKLDLKPVGSKNPPTPKEQVY